MIKNNYKNESGFSLLLVVLILSAMLITTLMVSDLILETGRSLAKVPHSEVALYAAESGAEIALYEINKKYHELDGFTNDSDVNDFEGGLSGFVDGAAYEINIGEDILGEDTGSDITLIQEDIGSSIGGLLVGRESLVLNYDLNTAKYDDLRFTFSGDSAGVVVSVVGFDFVDDEETNFTEKIFSYSNEVFVKFGEINRDYLRIRVFNGGGIGAGFTVKQKDELGAYADDPIIGVRILSHGQYKETERVVEVEHMKWQRFSN